MFTKSEAWKLFKNHFKDLIDKYNYLEPNE